MGKDVNGSEMNLCITKRQGSLTTLSTREEDAGKMEEIILSNETTY